MGDRVEFRDLDDFEQYVTGLFEESGGATQTLFRYEDEDSSLLGMVVIYDEGGNHEGVP